VRLLIRNHRFAGGIALGGRPGIRSLASGGLLTCHEIATCVHDRGHCAPPAGTCGSSNGPGCGPSLGAVHSTPAGRIKEMKKNFCCVTTRRRNFWPLIRLGRSFGSLAAHALSLCVPGFDLGGLPPLDLPPSRLPTANFPHAFGVLAIALVPTSRLVPPPAAFAQAEPRAKSSHSGTAAALWFIVVGAHGSCFSQGTARGECSNILFGRLTKHEPDCLSPI
jgi:hypothetical protein